MLLSLEKTLKERERHLQNETCSGTECWVKLWESPAEEQLKKRKMLHSEEARAQPLNTSRAPDDVNRGLSLYLSRSQNKDPQPGISQRADVHSSQEDVSDHERV